MACVYTFEGKTYDSELELDNFLIEKYPFWKQYGDEVFSSNPIQLNVKSKLDKLKEESQKHWDAYLQMSRNKEFSFDEDGEYDFIKLPYLGTTRYLSNKEVEGQHLFPKFIDKEYWDRKTAQWKRGEFNKTDQELFGYKEHDTPLSDQKCEENKNFIINKWKNQALSGTAVHNVLQLYFTLAKENGESKYVFEFTDPKQYILDNLEAENVPFVQDKIDSIMSYAKRLHDKLKHDLQDDNLTFIPEYLVYSEIQDDKVEKVLGLVDLLIIDSKGRTHILDYKTSTKDYSDFHDTKTLAYKYQMATYQRMLEHNGINMYSSRLMVAPIKLDNFRLSGDTYMFDGVSSNIIYDDITTQQMDTIYDKIDTFLPPKININITGQDMITQTETIMAKWFPDFPRDREITIESTKEYLEKTKRLTKNNEGKYVFKQRDSNKEIVSEDAVDFVTKVTEYLKTLGPRRIQLAGQIKSKIEEAINTKNPDITWPTSWKSEDGESVSWMKDAISPYCNGEWKVVDNPELETAYGIITIVNEHTRVVNFLRISNRWLHYNYREHLEGQAKRKLGLTAQFETDAQANSKARSLMAESASGNIEIMEMMAALNMTNGFDGYKIGSLAVVNPYDNQMVKLSNTEAVYCFSQLNQFAPMPFNKFQSKEIQMLTPFEEAQTLFAEIMNSHDVSYQSNDIFKVLNGCTSILDEVADSTVQDRIEALQKLLAKLESIKSKEHEFNTVYKQFGQLQQDHIRLANSITLAIAQLKGINFRQQLRDHGKWYQSILIHQKGLQGSYIDNPGNLTSETLNLITKLITEAYQNTRDDIMREKATLDKLIEAVKEESNFNYIVENLGANQVDLYKDMYEERDGDLFFKHPNEVVGPAKQALLEYALKRINQDRYGDDAETLLKNDDPRYYRVPLARGSKDSAVSTRGLLKGLREKLKEYSPKAVYARQQQKLEGLDFDDTRDDDKYFVFKMTNMFDAGNESIGSLDKRLNLIQKVGIHNLERNLETLLLKHVFAYSQQRNIDTVFPLIKASAIHLQQQGAMTNKYFKEDLDFIQDYIWNKVLNKSIVPPNLRGAHKFLSYLKQAASKFSLAFAPVQFPYQALQGLWQDISLMIRKPDGSNAFTFSNFKRSLKIAYSDLFNFSGNPTLCSRLNELYALNDMDMNNYIDRITKNRKGVYNFDNMLYKFSARPDYYNRLTIFLSQMQGDGCLEAHSMVDGQLVYDWTKDKRFEAFANKRVNDLEYNKQRALYYAVAQQFVNEHAKNPDGSEFVLDMNNPKPLPRAYTNKQAESMKSVSDNIYGYYSHEKKSLIMSTMLGSMWLQFKTFWSGKKNQYLQAGGVRLQGRWQEVIEKNQAGEDVHWYYQLDKNGQVDYELPPIPDKKPNENYQGFLADTPEKQQVPVVQWKGQWQEGILVSVAQTFKGRHTLTNFKELWNNSDLDLQTAYRSNIKQLGYDLLMFFVVGSILGAWLGDWLKDLEKENKKSTDFMDGVKVAAAKIAVMSVNNSFMDLNMFKSIGSPIGTWTPFALEWGGRTVKRFYNAAMGEQDWYDTVVKQFAVTSQLKPIFDVMKPEQFRTKAEGGTWESATAKRNRERRENG